MFCRQLIVGYASPPLHVWSNFSTSPLSITTPKPCASRYLHILFRMLFKWLWYCIYYIDLLIGINSRPIVSICYSASCPHKTWFCYHFTTCHPMIHVTDGRWLSMLLDRDWKIASNRKQSWWQNVQYIKIMEDMRKIQISSKIKSSEAMSSWNCSGSSFTSRPPTMYSTLPWTTTV